MTEREETITQGKIPKIKIKPVGQKNGGCGPASLRGAMDYWGVIASEAEIAEIAGTTPEKGTSKEGLIKAAKHFGFDVFIKENASLDDLRKYVKEEIPVIVAWFCKDDGHYSVVVDINKNNIILSDPALKKPFIYGNTRKMSCKKFQRLWFDFPDDFIKEPKDLILRMIMVITPKETEEPKKE
jgi:predicted double-glycine peptidase